MQTYFVDFNTMMADAERRVTIAQEGHDEELPAAQAGEHVLLTDDEMIVEGTVVFDAFPDGRRVWLAVPDWSTMRDLKPVPNAQEADAHA